MKTVATILVLISAAALSSALTQVEVQSKFDAFKLEFNKEYENEVEELRRLKIFAENLVLAASYNEKDTDATYGVTQFMDLTADEFKKHYLGFNAPKYEQALPVAADIAQTNATEIDWVSKGAVTDVKNQGQCGSCWAFSTTGNIEGVNFVKTGKLVSLSEQQLVDCDTKTGDQGCQGGLPSNAFKYIIGDNGIDTESSYPYKGVGGTCQATKGTVGAKISNWTAISTDEDQIAAQLVSRGPLSIGINAGPMQMYTGGVACPWKILCSPSGIDHGVLIVGFGTDGGKDYWKIKNSWGTGWGEQGYYRICKGKGACGLNTMVTSAIV